MSRRRSNLSPEELDKLLAGRHLHEPPIGTLRKAMALASRLPAPQSACTWLVEILFDSFQTAIQVRSETLSFERRLLYRLLPEGDGREELEVDMRLRRDARGRLELVGQVLPPEGVDQVEVVIGENSRRQVLDETGDFLFRGLLGSGITLRLLLDGGESVQFDPLPLPEETDRL